MKFCYYFPGAILMHILMNLNDFDTIFCANFIKRYFAQKTVNFLVLLENNNMKRLLMFPLCMIIFVLF